VNRLRSYAAVAESPRGPASRMRGVVAAVVLSLLCGAPALAQRGAFGLGQDLRLEGIVDPGPAAKGQALGTIRIRAGTTVRKFGVIRAQTSRTEGMSLFNRSSLHPEQLLLRANATMLGVFRNSPAGTRLSMLGRYIGDDFILASITPVDTSATPAPTAQPH
jgi:hypothetical protein